MSSKIVTQSITPLTVSVKEAAARTSLSPRLLWKAISEGKLKVLRVGGRVLIPWSNLREFIGI
jgi:excisionase family DNA binding protein